MFTRRKSRNYSLESYTGVSPNSGHSQGVNSNALAAAAAIGQSVSGSRSNSLSSYSPHYAQSYQGNSLPYISEEDGRLSRSNSRTTVRAHRASYNPTLRNKVSFSETNSDHTPDAQPKMVKKYVPSPHGLVAIEVPESSISRSGSMTRSGSMRNGSMTNRIPRSASMNALSAGNRQKIRNSSLRGSKDFERRMPRLVEEQVETKSENENGKRLKEVAPSSNVEEERKETDKVEPRGLEKETEPVRDLPVANEVSIEEVELPTQDEPSSLYEKGHAEPLDKEKEIPQAKEINSEDESTSVEGEPVESQTNLERVISSASSNYADPELGIVNHYKDASSRDFLTEPSDSSVMEKPSTATSINSSVDSSRKNMAQQMRSTIPSLNVPDAQKPISKRKSALKVSPSASQTAYNTLSTAENTRLNAQRSTLSLQKTYSPKKELTSSQQSLPLRNSQYISSPVKPPVKPVSQPVKTPTRSSTKTYPKNYPKSNARVKAEELYKKANSPANINLGPPDNSDLPMPPRRSSFEKSSANASPSGFRRTTMRPDAGTPTQPQEPQNRQPPPPQPQFQSRFADSDSDEEISHRPRAASVQNTPQPSGLQQRFYSDHLENKEKKQKKHRFGKLKKLFKRDKKEKA